MRVNKKLWGEFQKRTKMLNCRYEADLLEYILKRALYPRAKLLKVMSAEMVEAFDFIRELREKTELEDRTMSKEHEKPLFNYE